VRDHLLLKFLEFRLKQIGRLLKEVGIIRVLLLITIVLGFLLFQLNELPEQNILLILFYPLLILPYHLSRKDHAFLRKLDLSEKTFFAIEYNSLALLYSLLLAYNLRWTTILAGHILVTLIIFLPAPTVKKKRSVNSRLIKWIPGHLFEWRCYFRQHKLSFGGCYLLTGLLSFYTYAIPVGIFIFLTAMPDIFKHVEPKEFIETYPGNTAFVWSKIKGHSLFVHLLLSPLYFLFIIFHSQMWFLLVLLLLIVEFSVCFCLLYKYSRFHISTCEVHNQIPFAIFLMALILFFPVGIFLLYLCWKKTENVLPEYVKN
jgi:hypothetical protein